MYFFSWTEVDDVLCWNCFLFILLLGDHLVQRLIFIFGALGYFKLGPSGRFATTDVIHISTTREQIVPIHNHITLFWILSISWTETVIMKLTKKPAVKLSDNTPITYLLRSLCNCTVCKCQELALNEAPAVLLTTPNSLLVSFILLLYIVGDRRDFCLQYRWKFCRTLSF